MKRESKMRGKLGDVRSRVCMKDEHVHLEELRYDVAGGPVE